MRFETTGHNRIQSIKSCLLFDAKDGEIRHVHHVVTLHGAAETSRSQIEKRALALAADFGLDVKRLRSLYVEGDELETGSRYKVDVKSGRLSKIERK
jgi:hypothetical protein